MGEKYGFPREYYQYIWSDDADKQENLFLESVRHITSYPEAVGYRGRLLHLDKKVIKFLSKQDYGNFYDENKKLTELPIRPYLFFLDKRDPWYGYVNDELLSNILIILAFRNGPESLNELGNTSFINIEYYPEDDYERYAYIEKSRSKIKSLALNSTILDTYSNYVTPFGESMLFELNASTSNTLYAIVQGKNN